MTQESACKGLDRNGQTWATYTPIPSRVNSRSITRSLAQKSAYKDLSRNGQSPAITTEATYTPTSKRAGSRSLQSRRILLWQSALQ
ncbi:Conserved protein [Lacticaseibacillus rhamnosus GG]|nr:Conserved protein [Lacticaseibacillus rhamnosus GG]